MRDFHRGVRRFCAVLLGLVFFGAGMLKLMDPVGAGLVVDEYYKFLHLGFLSFSSKAVGTGMALIETILGASMLAGTRRKLTAIVTGLLLGGFTLLTLVLLIFNPQMDCGCFGEAVHLTHMQSFLKNVLLCLLWLAAFLPLGAGGKDRVPKRVAFWMVAAVVAAFTVYSLLNLPLIDFTEFAPGASLALSEEDEAGAEGISLSGGNDSKDEYYVIYEKNGQEGAFTLDRLPDSTWTFVRVEQLERSIPDYEKSVPLLYISDSEGEYHNELLTEGRVMVLSIYDNGKYRDEAKALKFVEDAENEGFKALVVTRGNNPSLGSYSSDYKKIITLNRSNGGVTYIDDGEIICKWPARSVPDAGELAKVAAKNPTEQMVGKTSRGRITFQGIMLYSLAVLLLL